MCVGCALTIVCEIVQITAHGYKPVDRSLILLDRALEVSGERTKEAAVTKALQEFIAAAPAESGLLELIGKLEWDESFDYKAERSRA